MIERMDTNNDGVISLEEAPDRLKQRFDRMDTDASGTVTAEEFAAAFKQMRGRGKKGQIGRNKSTQPQRQRTGQAEATSDGRRRSVVNVFGEVRQLQLLRHLNLTCLSHFQTRYWVALLILARDGATFLPRRSRNRGE